MNTFLKAIVLSISTAVVAAPVMAAPQDHGPQSQHNVKANQYKQHVKQYEQSRQAHKNINPHQAAQSKVNAQHWKVGQKVPNQYHGSNYKFDQSKYKKLSQPGRNQQWIKVKNDYVLMDTNTHKVLKVVQG